jgi:glycosyltransferase 2 family protein
MRNYRFVGATCLEDLYLQNVQGWGRNKRRTLIAVGLLIASVYVCVALFTDAAKLADALRQLGWLGCLAVLGLSLVNYLLRFKRWQFYLHRLGRYLPWGRHFLYYLSGFAFTVSPAKAGEAMRSLYLQDHGVTYPESIAALFVERLLDLFAITALASLIVFDHVKYRPMLIAAIALLAVVLGCVCHGLVPVWIDTLASRFGGSMNRFLVGFSGLLRSSRRLLRPGPLFFGFALGLAAWAAEGIGFQLICEGLHISGSMAMFVGIYALSVLAGSIVFFLPAGIGGMEIVMTTLLVEQGAPLPTAIIATLLCRLATLWFAVIIGVAAASTVELTHRPLPIGLNR